MHSIAVVNPPCVCERGDISCSNKENFDDDDDEDDCQSQDRMTEEVDADDFDHYTASLN